MKRIPAHALSFLSLFLVPLAVAQTPVPVTVDPVGYAGTYTIVGVLPASNTGSKLFNLAPGAYQVDIGAAGSCSRKSFVVNPDGTVANSPVADSSGAFDFAGSILRFRNTVVQVQGGGYAGRAWLALNAAAADFVAAPFSRVVVPDTVYRLRVDQSFTSTHFHVDAAGQVQPDAGAAVNCAPSNIVSASADSLDFLGSAVTFRTAPVRFDPRLYPGGYSVHPVEVPAFAGGERDVVLVRGFSQQVKLSSLDSMGQFSFRLQADGDLAHYTPPGSTPSVDQVDLDNAATPRAVRFRNTTAHFVPGDFAGLYRFDRSTAQHLSAQSGATSHVLVPGTRYEMRIGATRIGYVVDAAGNLQGGSFGALANGADLFDLQGETAYFRTTRVAITPTNAGDAGLWRIVDVTPAAGLSGPLQAALVVNATYALNDLDAVSGGTANFSVGAPCSVTPSSISFPGNSSYRLTCVPRANAGADASVGEGSTVVLDGSGSFIPGGGQPTHSWSQVGGPAVSLSDSGSATPSFVAPSVAGGSTVLTFQLVVSDGYAFSDADSVNITVVNVNSAPAADAGDDFSIREGATGQLVGTNSYDPDGDGLGYLWTQVGGTPVTLLPGNTAPSPTFVAPLANGAPLVFRLAVFDGDAWSAASPGNDPAEPDVVQVTVGANTAPVANAGADLVANEGTVVTLDGNASNDSDGDGITFQWTQVSGSSAVTLSGATSATPSFTAPPVGAGGEVYAFSLVVTDDYAFNPRTSVPDVVLVNVQDTVAPPRCDLAEPGVASLWPPDHKLREVVIRNVVDPNGGTPAVTVTAVTQDEPVDGLGDGDTQPDASAAGAGKVLLRAERSGQGNGRVYRVHFQAVANGQSCSGAVTVVVPKTRQSTAIDDGQAYSSF